MWDTEFCRAADGMSVACFDLDSTMRSTMHRRWMLPEIRAGHKTWDDYSLLASGDVPVEGTVALARLFSGFGVLNFAVSGTSAGALGITSAWARRHDVPLNDFLLRPAGDYTPNGEWKVACVRRLEAAGLRVVLFVEDWRPVAAYIRERTGVPVLGINPFDEGTELVDQQQLTAALTAIAQGSGIWPSRDRAPELAGPLFSQLGGAF